MTVMRKQLEPSPETNDNYLSAEAQWFKFTVDHTDLNSAVTSLAVTLATVPAATWIHAVHWKSDQAWAESTWFGEGTDLLVKLGDEDDDDKWLTDIELYDETTGNSAVEDGIGLTPYMPDSANTHDLIATFTVNKGSEGDNLDDLTAGSMTFWFLMSSMDLS